MGNWFEDNPTKSVLIHTVVVATATWAAFTFVFDENRIKLHEAKVARAESETKEVNARNLVLATRVDYLTKENEQLHRWLESEPKTVPYYENQLSKLSQKVLGFEESLRKAQSISSEKQGSDWLQRELEKYNATQTKPVQMSIYDPFTNVVIGADRVSIEGKTDIKITLPDGKKIENPSSLPGDTWDYEYQGKNYRIILDSADWATQQFGTRIIELKQ